MKKVHVGLVCWTLLQWCTGVHSANGCTVSVLELSLNDSMQAGDVVQTFMYNIDVKNCPILKATNKSLILMNNTKNICAPEVGKCEIVCHAHSKIEIPVSLSINRKENYTLKFEDQHYTAKVYEESPINTRVTIEPRVNVYIEECMDNEPESTRFFSLKGGDGLFKLGIQTKADSLEVNGTLDYEQTKTYALHLFYKDGLNFNPDTFQSINFQVRSPYVAKSIFDIQDDTSMSIVTACLFFPANGMQERPDLHFYIYLLTRFPKRRQYQIFRSSPFIKSCAHGFCMNSHEQRAVVRMFISPTNVYMLKVDDKKVVTTASFDMQDYLGEGSTTIYVTVLDIDDQNPTFDNILYQLNVTENDSSTVNTDLTTTPPIHAYDQDFGINRSIIYTIIDQEQNGLFIINNVTGRLSVTSLLDRENTSSYTIIIKASQTDKSYRTATATVIVNVQDIDDNIPVFQKKEYSASVNEHSTNGTIIVIVTATDKDQGHNAKFTYKLKHTNAKNTVAVNQENGEVTVIDSSRFDRESFDGGIINIEVETVPMNTSYPGDVANVTIHLIDINDNNPNFTETNYIFEAVKAGESLGQVFAEDYDEGPNANVTYHFIQASKSEELCKTVSTVFPFAVDNLTGNITIESELFCQRYYIMIEACDNPLRITMRRCSTASVMVHHNTTREIKHVSQTMTVSENSPVNTTVDVIRCSGHSYEIQDGENGFIVDATTFSPFPDGNILDCSNLKDAADDKSKGLLMTNKTLDREKKQFHLLTVNVSSNGEVFCQVNISIQIADLNDNPPIFQNVTDYVFNLEETPAIKIGEVHAIDSDLGQNAELMYSFQNKREGRFSINETTGDIYAVNPTNLEIDVIRLVVEARDLGVPSLNSMENVFILPRDQPPDLVPIISALSKDEIEEKANDLKSDLQAILRTDIAIQQIDTMKRGTMIQLKLLNQTYNRRTALATIVDNYDKIRNLFYTSEAKPVIDNNDKDEFGAAEIGLIVMAVVVLIGIIIAVVVVKKQCSRAEKYQHLYESLTRNSSIYESQEIKVKMEDDTSQLNGVVNSEEIIPSSEFVASATVNPAYEQDDTNFQTDNEIRTDSTQRLQSLNSSETSVEDAMESLDQLSDRLEQEVGENGAPAVYAHVDVSKKESNHSENASINSIFLNENGTEVHGNCEETDKQDVTHYENVPDNLAMKVLQAKANSSVLTRKREDSDTDDINDEYITNDNVCNNDEPDPDYDNKQVRFSTEVLVADGIKVEPPKKEINDEETTINEIVGYDSTEQQPAIPRLSLEDISVENDNRDPGDLMLEEEISSPMDVLNDTENNDFFFGTDEETTHF